MIDRIMMINVLDKYIQKMYILDKQCSWKQQLILINNLIIIHLITIFI